MERDQQRALVRVRNIAAASAALESLKLLPLLDVVVLLVEWLGLKTALPIALEVWDRVRDGDLSARSVLAAPLHGNWLALITRAFGGVGGLSVLLADVGTDSAAAALPAPLDGFDIPPMLADAIISLLAHRELDRLRAAEAPQNQLLDAVGDPPAAMR